MNIKDIVNHEVSTITNCESEPIHIPGSIQPHGVLLALDEDLIIRYCSNNTEDVFGQKPAALLRQGLSIIDTEQKIETEVKNDERKDAPFIFETNNQTWNVFIREAGDLFLLEFEPLGSHTHNSELIFDQTTQFISFIESARNLQELSQHIADETRNVTGYDRVMIYRFDEEYNGEVFAESKREDLEPFLNLHYPHTDIPPQARELYLRQLVRMIADVHYEPVPVVTMEDASSASVDLSICGLRSVSPIHIQYLKNMHVGATLTISLILENRLWGLIACHHYTPLYLTYAQRRAALLYGHFLSSQIKVRQVAEEYEVYSVVEAHLQQLLNAMQQDGDFGFKFRNFTSLLSVTNSSGAAILHRGQLYEKGLVPSRDRVKELFQWLSQNTTGVQFTTDHLAKYYGNAEKISQQAAGIVYFKLGDATKDAIIWFRAERERTINWAGNPATAIQKTVTNQLTPRSSFALFKQKIRNQSRDWKVSEINAATRFASSLQNQLHLEYLQIEENRQRLLNEQLQKANKELANINWITTHDLKEPLRKILLFSSKAMSDEDKALSETLSGSLTKIQSSAMRMQALVNDIISYSLTDDKQTAFVETDLNEIMREVLKEFEDDFRDKHISCLVEQMPVINAIPYQMRQLFINLIGNSVKFARKDEPLSIEISCSQASGSISSSMLEENKSFCLIRLKDNGIGFKEEQNTKIFDIFYRLNDKASYAGTGIGLAICKRIVENHGGRITASGEPGVGASFSIYLPC